MAFERVGDIIVLVHGLEDPGDSEWQSYVVALHHGLLSEPPLRGCLVTTQGGAPNAGQRKAMLDLSSAKPVPTCVCTDSRVARGVITAVSWLYAERMHALKMDEIGRALKLLNVPAAVQPQTVAAVNRLQAELSVWV